MANIDITNRRGDIVVQVADNQINEPAPSGITSINVVGRNVLDYGDEIGNNLHWIMENFANITAPEGKVDGQLWWDISNSSNPVLRVYSGIISSWATVTKIKDDTTPELSASLNAAGNKIINLLNPVNAQDASTKGYVDNEIALSLGAASDTIISLTDTPATFLGQANKILKVNTAQDSVIFDNINFLELTDTPGLYLGAANQVVKVNAAANALEFKLLALTDLASTGPLNMGGFRIEAVGNPNTSDDVINLGYADDRYLRDTSGNTNGIVIRVSSTGETISRTISAGAGITVSNGSGVSGNPIISHADTSSQSSINNSGSVVIQDITLDTYGHVTGIASTSLAIPSTGYNDDRYLRDTSGNANGFVVRTSSTGETVARTLVAGTNITITNTNGVNGNPVISATIPATLPVGTIVMHAGPTGPGTGSWALCDGQAYSITNNGFVDLYNVIGTAYGSGGAGTFRVPDLSGMFPLGSGNGFMLGDTGGDETHTLTIPEMPSHNHTGPLADGGGSGGDIPDEDAGGAIVGTYTTNSTGGGAAHNNMPPYTVIGYWIKR